MKKMQDSLFGELAFDLYWKKEYEVSFLGQKKKITILIDGDESGVFEDEQREAYSEFINSEEKLFAEAEKEIFNYYKSIYIKYRDKFEYNTVEKLVPEIFEINELNRIVNLKEIIFPWTVDGERALGLLFDCTWEKEHGLAVKFENENIVEVGYQDIVL